MSDPPQSILGTGLQQVQRVLAEVPPEKTAVAVVTYDGRSVRAGVAVRAGAHWTFGAEGRFERELDELTGFLYVKAEW